MVYGVGLIAEYALAVQQWTVTPLLLATKAGGTITF